MPKKFVYKFRVTGMYGSVDVATVRNKLAKIPGVSAVNVDLRKMQVDMAAAGLIGASALRNALGNVDFELSELTTRVIFIAAGVRDDELDEPGSS